MGYFFNLFICFSFIFSMVGDVKAEEAFRSASETPCPSYLISSHVKENNLSKKEEKTPKTFFQKHKTALLVGGGILIATLTGIGFYAAHKYGFRSKNLRPSGTPLSTDLINDGKINELNHAIYNGGDVNAYCVPGVSGQQERPLVYAVLWHQFDAAVALLTAGAKVELESDTPEKYSLEKIMRGGKESGGFDEGYEYKEDKTAEEQAFEFVDYLIECYTPSGGV